MIERFFPTLIGYYDNPHHSALEKDVSDRCFELEKTIKKGGVNIWLSDTVYNTDGTYETWEDKHFKGINDFVLEKVTEYANEIGLKDDCLNYRPYDSWFTIYRKGDYQEYHTHGSSVISAIYFVKANDKSAKVYFKSPIADHIVPEYKERSADTWERIFYDPKPGRLVVFRSYLEHCVEMQKDKESRISLAYNFKKNYA
tara:strand:+ start:110 stop:706 length:597 start_codon:yes stop_codon:yes gene_type:complete